MAPYRKFRQVLLTVVVLMLLPMNALAAVCFSPSLGSTFVITVAGEAEGFFTIVGELIGPCAGPGLQHSAPVNGTAHLRPDGRAHTSLMVGPTTVCSASFYEAILDPPFFNSGVGQVDTPTVAFFQPRVYTPVACPSLPRQAE